MTPETYVVKYIKQAIFRNKKGHPDDSGSGPSILARPGRGMMRREKISAVFMAGDGPGTVF
jgi:hypothetical protein